MFGISVLKQYACAPVKAAPLALVDSEAMLTSDKPGRNAGKNLADLKLHGNLFAVGFLLLLLPERLEGGRLEGQALYDQADVGTFAGAIGEIESLHKS